MALVQNRTQFQDLFPEILTNIATVDPGSLADGAGSTHAVTITGAALGDMVLFSIPLDLVDMTVTAYVAAANSVEVRIQNESGAVVDLASSVWKIAVLKTNPRYFM